jgi:hypothetical protein
MLKLRIVQAQKGDCLVLVYGTNKAHYMLIDGGPGGVFETYLAPELKRIQAAGGQLDQVVLSHIDDDHAHGVLDFFTDLRRPEKDGWELEVGQLWHNTFSQTVGAERALMVVDAIAEDMAQSRDLEEDLDTFLMDIDSRSIDQGDKLTRAAAALHVPVNPGFPPLDPKSGPQGLVCVDTAPTALEFDGITVQVAGPSKANLERLEAEWDAWLKKHGERALDTSYANLSSLMLLVTSRNGKKILFTGDGRGDEVLAAVNKAGLLDKATNKLEIDALKMPHHGSIRNATPEFFKTIVARHYVISADGENDNPDYDTLKLLTDVRKADKEPYCIWITNETDSTCRFRNERPPSDTYRYRFVQLPYGLPAEQQVLELDLDLADPAAAYPPLPGPYRPVAIK